MTITRRDFFQRAGALGGYAAVYSSMLALGMMPASAQSALPDMPADLGRGRKVVILGAGIAGLVSAYELRRAGFDVTVLEASQRPGGRNWTARRGTTVDFLDGTRQRCDWADGAYFNMGPARIPSIHRHLLGYCGALGVPLEVEINTSRSAFMQADALNGGKPVTQRRVIHDTRGYIAELLVKAIDRHTIDDALSGEDRERLRAFLKDFGALGDRMTYSGSERGGYTVARGAAAEAGTLFQPLPLSELLAANLAKGEFYEEHIDWQATMFQPVGGMDRIPNAFAKALEPVVRYGAPVSAITNRGQGVRIAYTEGGTARTLDADFCISTLPAPILRDVKGLSPATIAAARAIQANALYKIAWESPRFWESDDNIYGGISFLQQTVDLVWYPSWSLFSPSGVVVAGFNLEVNPDGSPTEFGKLGTMDAKLAASRRAMEILHPGKAQLLAKPLYMNWAQIPWQKGCVGMTDDPAVKPAYDQLNRPDGRVWFAADWLSHLTGWQEGAILSAHRAVAGIAARVRA